MRVGVEVSQRNQQELSKKKISIANLSKKLMLFNVFNLESK